MEMRMHYHVPGKLVIITHDLGDMGWQELHIPLALMPKAIATMQEMTREAKAYEAAIDTVYDHEKDGI